MPKSKVTIVSISYNHEKYIAQALESFIMQKTDFVFEVIIADDCSTDGTSEIIRRYADKYPEIIKPVFRKQNLGPLNNFIDALSVAKSQYVIYCEGDDYFTDPLKLQKQVDFLDANSECSICFHPVKVIFENAGNTDYIFPQKTQHPLVYLKKYMNLDDLLKFNFIQTNSCMYRWRFNGDEKIEEIFPKNILPGDWFLHLLHAEKGKIGFINETMSVYRRHTGGLWYDSESGSFWQKNGLKYIAFCDAVKKYFKEKTDNNVQKNISDEYFRALLKLRDFEQLKLFSEQFVYYYEMAIEKTSLAVRLKSSLKYRSWQLCKKILYMAVFIKYLFKK